MKRTEISMKIMRNPDEEIMIETDAVGGGFKSRFKAGKVSWRGFRG